MDKKIEEAQQEFNAILHYIVHMAMGREIHEVEAGIYRRLLRLGRILLDLFVLSTGTGKTGETLMRNDGSILMCIERVLAGHTSTHRLRPVHKSLSIVVVTFSNISFLADKDRYEMVPVAVFLPISQIRFDVQKS
jgi:hypothetical protein